MKQGRKGKNEERGKKRLTRQTVTRGDKKETMTCRLEGSEPKQKA